jgi:hypothetical protein
VVDLLFLISILVPLVTFFFALPFYTMTAW